MNAHIQGMGWVTPLGGGLASVWKDVERGTTPPLQRLDNPFNGHSFLAYRVDQALVAEVIRQPRLRRSSVISHFAFAAALDALTRAGFDSAPERLALVFASTNGGVIYTRRFFAEVSKFGTQAGSPLLFPETVYNAPASHIAALLGITGIVVSLVNDATAGIDAIAAACELLDSGACDHCLVAAAEETDWVLCEAYAAWGLAASEPPIVPFSGQGTIFAEGAAALLLAKDGDGPCIERIHRGSTFQSTNEARKLLGKMEPDGTPQAIVSSAGGTRFDQAEEGLPADIWFTPKASLGEAFTASTLMQVIGAALALKDAGCAFVPVTGFHGQVAGITLASNVRDSPRPP